MVAAPMALVLKTAVGELNAAKSEQKGVAPARAILNLIRLTQEHRGLSSATLNGDLSKSGLRQERQASIDAALDQVLQTLGSLASPALTGQVQDMRTQWNALASDVGTGTLAAPASLARHTKLVDEQMLLLEDLTYVSGLELDPEAASYRLIIASTRDLPRLTERLGRARAKGVAILASQADKHEERQELVKSLAEINLYERDVQRGFERASVGETASLGPLSSSLDGAAKALAMATQWINKVGQATPGQVTTGDYFQGMTQAINAHYDLTEVAWNRVDEKQRGFQGGGRQDGRHQGSKQEDRRHQFGD